MRGAVVLAVDLGLRTGLAGYGADGRLVGYRSSNVGTRTRLRAAAEAVLRDAPDLELLVLEGDRRTSTPWQRAGERRGVRVLGVRPETWREALLPPRDQRSGAHAKQAADRLAREVIAWSGLKRPTSLRHDAAEAIAIGLWAVRTHGHLSDPPPSLQL